MQGSDFGKFIDNLVNDTILGNDVKKMMLQAWREKLLGHNSNRIMDKAEAANHFEWLELIDKASMEVSCQPKVI